MISLLLLIPFLGLPAAADEGLAPQLLLGYDGPSDLEKDSALVTDLVYPFPFADPEVGLAWPGWAIEETDPEAGQDKDKDRERRDPNAVAFTIGPAAGYLRVRDADRGTWFGGLQARVQFLRYLGIEGSITFHQNRFADGDIIVTQYPVQVTGLLFPFPDSEISPYVLVGAGWYYTRVDFDSSLGGGEETERLSGWHVGAGAQATLGRRVGAFGDFRWVFIDDPGVDNSNIDEEEFDYWQVTLGLNIGF